MLLRRTSNQTHCAHLIDATSWALVFPGRPLRRARARSCFSDILSSSVVVISRWGTGALPPELTTPCPSTDGGGGGGLALPWGGSREEGGEGYLGGGVGFTRSAPGGLRG